jgi:3-hydroxyisobutyrate dehydrogenase-like beta-hydroxyacid dehydrogenase
VADDAALTHITQGNAGIASNLKAGGIHVSISTVLPATSTHLSEIHQQHNNHYIACPVMGRPEAVRARKLNFIVTGNTSAIQIIKPFLQDAGATGIWEFGENVSHANVAKLCSNFLIASAIEALAEGINLTKKSGMDAQQWINMLTQTIFNSSVYINYGNIILNETYQPAAFSLGLGLKDINLVMEQAAETNAQMTFGKVLQERMHQCVANGLGEYDWTAIALALREKSVV